MSSHNNSRPYGKSGPYATELSGYMVKRPCGGQHHNGPFAPLCFICGSAIGRMASAGWWKIDPEMWPDPVDWDNVVWVKDSEVAWTQWYRAIIFNSTGDIGLSEVGHVFYHGPWLEPLELPLKDRESGKARSVEFYPLCYHYSETEKDFDTFGCTMHATCWELLEQVIGTDLQNNQLAKLAQLLRGLMFDDHQGSCHEKKFYLEELPPGFCSVQNWWPLYSYVWAMCDPKDIPELEAIYSACKKPVKALQQSGKDGCSGKSQDDIFDELYARLPPEVKIMVLEYLEGKRWSKLSDPGRNLQEYWRKRLFKQYSDMLIDVKGWELEDMNWQLLYNEIDKLAASETCRGWRNRRRILSLVKEEGRRYARKADVNLALNELMLYDEEGKPKKVG